MSELRIGVLGAAAIAPMALYTPAAAIDGVRVTTIAARDRSRAEAAAAKHSIPTVVDNYDALLAADIDAVYVPLPNGLHGKWAHLAIMAGHHVLCEKPLTANATEARELQDAARVRPNQVVTEAFHWSYHPWVDAVRAELAAGAIGEIISADGSFCVPNVRPGDIRWDASLAGGALMDLGCYPLHMLRTFLGSEPTVLAARGDYLASGVDRRTRAVLDFGGVRATLDASMLSPRFAAISLVFRGTRGEIRVFNPVLPHVGGRITVAALDVTRRIPVERVSTYECQLRAFVAACAGDVNGGVVSLDDSVANMVALDEIRAAAGGAPLHPTA